MKRVLTFLLIFLAISLSFAGGGWVYKQGKGYLKVGQWWTISPSSFDAFGNRTNLTPVGYFNTSIYGEIGLSDRLTGILYLPFISRMTLYRRNTDPLEVRESLQSFGDVDIGFKYGLIQDQTFVSSATVTIGVPFGLTGQGRDQNLATGDGELNFMIRLDGSFSWAINQVQGWGSAYTAYNNRSLNFNDEFRYGLEVGAKFWKDRILAIARMDRIDAIGEFEVNPGSIFSNNIEHLSFGGELGFNFTKKLGIAATLTKAVSGKTFYVSPSYALGLYLNI